MSTMNKQGHPVLGLVLGLIGIAVVALLVIFFGVIAGAVGGVLGLIAILLGVGARKGGRGMGAIITGAIAIVLAVSLSAVMTNAFTQIRDLAVRDGDAPLVAQYCDKPYLGMYGILSQMPTEDEAMMNEFRDQMDRMGKRLNSAESADPAGTDVPAQEAPAAEAPAPAN